MRVACCTALLLAFAACSTGTGLARCDGTAGGGVVCARLDQPFDLRVGETAYVADTRLSIRVDSVPEDSRCPTNAVCVWAGNARVSLTLREGTGVDAGEVNSTLEPHAITRRGYTVALVEVRPGRLAGEPLAAGAYVIRLVARRASG